MVSHHDLSAALASLLDHQDVKLSQQVCTDLRSAEKREWLITNGIGGFGMGTVAGTLSRRYHGLLVAALRPPLGRTLLATKLDCVATVGDDAFPLFSNRWSADVVDPHGYRHLTSFALDGSVPTWTFALADAIVQQQIWMVQGENTTMVRWRVVRGSRPVTLKAKALVNYRDYHGSSRADAWLMAVDALPQGLRITAHDGAHPFTLHSSGDITPRHAWTRDFYHAVEAYRGFDDPDDNLHVADLQQTLAQGEEMVVVFSAEPNPTLDATQAFERQRQYEQSLVDLSLPDRINRLRLAADQFIVARDTPTGTGHTIMAGYPWFTDWGRDTMIALPGLTLATGRFDIARSILLTFSHFIDRGMIPNRFPDEGETPEYNTVDATLWYIEALRAYVAATRDTALIRVLFSKLVDIIDWHRRGTRYGIGQDRSDGLLRAGEAGVQLTWMDAKVGDWVVTPRIGKPVEINALWYNALRSMAEFATMLGEADPFSEQAVRVRQSFAHFWNPQTNGLFDVLAPDDAAFRPNQLFAVALHHSPLSAERQQAIVDGCAQRLYTPHGMRSLAPDDPAYSGLYGGDQRERDGAYHQGTVWGWLIGPFISAYRRVYGDAATEPLIEPLLNHLLDGCVGSISEIFDGDAPFAPRGCSAQAWSVAELLRILT